MSAVIELDASNRITVLISGKAVVMDVEADTESLDMDEDMSTVAGTIAWYTQVLAAARQHCDLVEARYRVWQSKQLKEYVIDDPKVAEWKAKAALNAEPEFMEHKTAQAEAWALVNRLDGAVKALAVKADMLRSRGAMLRTEITHLDRSIPGPAAKRGESVEGKGARLKEHLKGD